MTRYSGLLIAIENLKKKVLSIMFDVAVTILSAAVNSLLPKDMIMTSYKLSNIGLGSGSLPNSAKPLPKPMWTNHKLGILAFTWGQFYNKCLRIYPSYEFENYFAYIIFSYYNNISSDPWVMCNDICMETEVQPVCLYRQQAVTSMVMHDDVI